MDMDNIIICKASDLEDIFKKILKENELIKNKTDENLNVQQASNYLKISISKLYKDCNLGKIPFCKIGKKLIFKKNDLDEYLKFNSSKNSLKF